MIRYVAALALTIASAAPGLTQQSSDEQVRQAALAKIMDGLEPGTPIQCVLRGQVTTIKSYGNTILYFQGSSRILRNDVVGGCGSYRSVPVSRSSDMRYCSGDVVEYRDSSNKITGVCSLGVFVPYLR